MSVEGQCSAALALFEEMLSKGKACDPGILACNYVLTKFAHHGAGAAAVKFLHAMQV